MADQQQRYSIIARQTTPWAIRFWFMWTVRAFHRGAFSKEEYQDFLLTLVAADRQGTLWTIGAATGKWYRKDGDRWVEGEPPDELYLPVPEDGWEQIIAEEGKIIKDWEKWQEKIHPSHGLS